MGDRRWYPEVAPGRGGVVRGEHQPAMNWQRFLSLMEGIRGRWDIAILANLAGGISRPSDLLGAINAQVTNGRRLTWKVMRERLRHLELAGYVGRWDVCRFPRETRYWATGFACRLLVELHALDTWYAANAPSLHPADPAASHRPFPEQEAD
jgi:DNA-binding HxlR family transcriptional regulator